MPKICTVVFVVFILTTLLIKITLAADLKDTNSPFTRSEYCNQTTRFCISGPKDWELNFKTAHSQTAASFFAEPSPLVAIYMYINHQTQHIGTMGILQMHSQSKFSDIKQELFEGRRLDLSKEDPKTKLIQTPYSLKGKDLTWTSVVFLSQFKEKKILTAIYVTQISENIFLWVDVAISTPETENGTYLMDTKNSIDDLVAKTTLN